MDTYMDTCGGCFDGEGLVCLSNGALKKVKDLCKGDVIRNSLGKCSRVVCLVMFPVRRALPLVRHHGLLITPRHPVNVAGVWHFAKQLQEPELVYCDCIYNLVLDEHHFVTINGLDLITLGHGMDDNAVVQHSYYGTEKVIQDLQRVPGWAEGRAVLHNYLKIKDPLTGLVVAFTPMQVY